MESANSHHHLQDQLVASSSSASSLTTPSNCYGLPSTTHAWTTSPTSFFSYPNEATSLSSRESRQQENTTLDHLPHYNSMAPEIVWANSSTQNFTSNDHCGQDLQQHSRIKDEELADHYYRKYTEILSSTSPSSSSPDHHHHNDLGTKLLLKSFSSGNLINKIHLSQDQDHFYSHNNINGAPNNARGLCQIFPSVNVSSLNQNQGFGAFDMNLEAIDLLASSRFSANFAPSSHNQSGIFRDGFSFGFDHMQQSLQIPFYGSNNHNKVSASSNAVVEPKRNCNKMDPKTLIQNAPKKSRLEARSSCPPFKVRKEKLGDRIAALQQLVAPFGKTDTASVLMEAIGYIKFLQSQVETLSVPYMKASRNKPNRVMKGGVVENENEESKRDLRSRGLCLVPLSCLSYITDGGGAAVWPPPHFGGAT